MPRRPLGSLACGPRGVFAIALGIGLLTVVAMDLGYRDYLIAQDSTAYLQLADSLASGHGYVLPGGVSGSSISPLFPVVLAVLRLIPLDIVAVTGVANALWGAIACVLLYAICRRTFADRRVAPVAGLLLAVYPLHLWNTGYVLKENLALAALMLAIAAWIEAMHRGSAALAFGAGAATALAIMARYYPTAGLPIVFLASLVFERARRGDYPWQRLAAAYVACMALGIVPWLAHNWIASGQLRLSPAGIGYYLLTSNGPGVVPDSSGYFEGRGLQFDPAYLPQPDAPNEQLALTTALATIVSDPARMARLETAKAVSFWRPVWEGSALRTWMVLGVPYLMTAALALVGVLRPGPGRFRFVLWGVIVLYTLVHLVFWGMIRERSYLEPLFIAFAARGLLVLADALRAHFGSEPNRLASTREAAA